MLLKAFIMGAFNNSSLAVCVQNTEGNPVTNLQILATILM